MANVPMMKIRRKGYDRGFGAMEILVFVAVVSVVFLVFYFSVDFILGVKQRRIQSDWEQMHARNRKAVNTMDRGPGRYRVQCDWFLGWSCRQVHGSS